MFTGLVYNLGTILDLKKDGDSLHLCISSNLPPKHFKRGASVAVDGVCLTVEKFEISKKCFWATAIAETLSKTCLGDLKKGSKVHLEPPLTLSTPLGGHLVTGHVDGKAKILEPAPHLKISIAPEYEPFCALKGSVTIWGVSLTIAKIGKGWLQVELIPETIKKTKLGILKCGDEVHIEVDWIARTLEHLYSVRR